MSSDTNDFSAFFLAATGHEPYGYQKALGEAEAPPAVLNVPTGAGKTQALIVSWLHARRGSTASPRRLVYALPMRSLVEQTRDVALEIRSRLRLDDELLVSTLIGGSDRDELRAWQLQPERSQILIGTIDMLLSRALNRGYATSRFMWPVPFGLLNNDCRWIFDEVQLMGPARATSAQLEGLRTKLGTVLPCETVWVSATIDTKALETIDHSRVGAVMTLPDEDRGGPLRSRLEARKILKRADLTEHAESRLPAAIAATTHEHHVTGTRTLLVLNTVGVAQSVYEQLQNLHDGRVLLLHSRFREPERREHMQDALAQPDGSGTIVVTTQVVEAGIDMSARTLITETAPASSIVQRLGRCNREGEYEQATVVWIDKGPLGDGAAAAKAAAPYPPDDVEHGREILLARVGESLAPAALEQLALDESSDDPTVLRRQDLLDLFDTTPDLSGLDVDVAPFIRDDDERDVVVFFRDIVAEETSDQPEPQRDELVKAPLASLGKRMCWTIDPVDGRWIRRNVSELIPGATVMLSASDGGYSHELGWDGKYKGTVEVHPPEDPPLRDSIGSDHAAEMGPKKELLEHLREVADEVGDITDALALAPWREALRVAGALHDVGKAHPVFQAALRSAIDDEAAESDGRLWAKSGSRKRISYERPYFRHELASALAVWQLDGTPEIPARELTAYLIAAHHGKVRLSIRPTAEESRPRDAPDHASFALGIVDGDELPAVQTPLGQMPSVALRLSPMLLGAEDSWADVVVHLRDDPDIGPFRLAFLEAVLRIADWRASDA